MPDHMFYAPVDDKAGPVTLEAVNRWGETFAARLP